MECNVGVTHSWLCTSMDTINYTIEHILQFINSNGVCVRRVGAPRAAASGRLRMDPAAVTKPFKT